MSECNECGDHRTAKAMPMMQNGNCIWCEADLWREEAESVSRDNEDHVEEIEALKAENENLKKDLHDRSVELKAYEDVAPYIKLKDEELNK